MVPILKSFRPLTGKLVLIYVEASDIDKTCVCFRPLTGKLVLIVDGNASGEFTWVSVPLRGSWF